MFPDLHAKVARPWETPYSARLFSPNVTNYSSILGLKQHVYGAMPRVEQTHTDTSYLSPESALPLKAPALPTKPLRTTLVLVSKAFTVAGQAGACLHTMAVLDAPLFPLGLFGDALSSVAEWFQEKKTSGAVPAVPPPPSPDLRGCWAGAALAVYQLLIQAAAEKERCFPGSPAERSRVGWHS